MADKTYGPDSIFEKSGEVIVRVIEGETVLLDLNSGIYYSLDDVGGRIWELIDGEKSLSLIVGTVADEYDVAPAQALEDAVELLADLAGEGLARTKD